MVCHLPVTGLEENKRFVANLVDLVQRNDIPAELAIIKVHGSTKLLHIVCSYTLNSAFNRRINPLISSGTDTCSLTKSSKSIISNSLLVPDVKSSPRPCLTENFSICRASIRSGLMRFRRAHMVSFADEKTRSQGTADPWIGKKSNAAEKSVGKRS